MARRVVTKGAELILREEPFVIPEDVSPIGDPARPSASLMLVPIRNRTQVIGLLSIQSYTPKAYQPADLATLQALADHCGGALERIRAEQALRDSEQRFRELFEGSPDAVFVEDVHGGVLDVNPAACRLHGMTREDLMGRNISELVPPGEQAAAAQKFQELVEGRLAQIEGASYTRDGRIVPVEIRASRITYANQPAVLLHVRDIADRKRAEAALRSSEMLFHSVWENSADGMRLTDEHGNIVAVNEAFCKLVGLRREELEGKPLTVTEAGPEPPEQRLMEYCQRFREGATEKQKERQLTLRNGQEVILEETNSRVELRGRPPLQLGIFRDVMAQKRLEEQLRQSQKMEAIGQLAGGVAHDFNNMLGVILGNAELALETLDRGSPLRADLEEIIHAAKRSSEITQQLLAFARKQMVTPRVLDLNQAVDGMLKMLGRLVGENISLHWEPGAPAIIVEIDPAQLHQILTNLCVNARDAITDVGVITIRTAITRVDTPLPDVQNHESAPGLYATLSVSDTGCGMDPETIAHLFEPFYTTKGVGKGTGLGLATVLGIVQQNNGFIRVGSEPWKGTAFTVYLPLRDDAPEETAPEGSQALPDGHGETVLIAEDEEAVLRLSRSILEKLGYTVLAASSPKEAWQLAENYGGPISLLLTDVIMPGMNGRDLAKLVKQKYPGVRCLFMSGYTANVIAHHGVLDDDVFFIQKPFSKQELAACVKKVLGHGDKTGQVREREGREA